MKDFTFEGAKKANRKKEEIEWLRIWCENTNDDTLPRVALIGDSITAQGYDFVKRELNGIANVDHLATSYSILSPAYVCMVEKFLQDSDYAVVCFNYGLHGFSVTAEEYEKAYREMLKKFLKRSKVVVTLTTDIHTENVGGEEVTNPVVIERNKIATALANEFNLTIDDAYSISNELGKDGKVEDGVHFTALGAEKLGVSKANAIQKVLGI